MTEIISKNDQEMLINHFENSFYLHHYSSLSWNNAVIAVICNIYNMLKVYFKILDNMWIQDPLYYLDKELWLGVTVSRRTKIDFLTERGILYGKGPEIRCILVSTKVWEYVSATATSTSFEFGMRKRRKGKFVPIVLLSTRRKHVLFMKFNFISFFS